MEEDIKRAEEFIYGIKECGLHDCSGYKDLDIKSIENLIKGYRELEENWISKSKIKEKIEELKEIADEDNMEAYVKIQVLQELMGDK